MLILGFLGFTNFSHSLPLNDKLLHFICFFIATTVFYFIFDVEEWVVLFLCWYLLLHRKRLVQLAALCIEIPGEYGFGVIRGWYSQDLPVFFVVGYWVRLFSRCFLLVLIVLSFYSESHNSPQYKEFQIGDVMVYTNPLAYSVANICFQANLLGSSIGLYLAYHMERYYRRRREVCSFYSSLLCEPC